MREVVPAWHREGRAGSMRAVNRKVDLRGQSVPGIFSQHPVLWGGRRKKEELEAEWVGSLDFCFYHSK